MLIGELSKRTGFSHDTIRFYEKKGLILVDRKVRRDNNYKEYPESAYGQLMVIKTVKTLGFTLHEIRDLMQTWDEEASCSPLAQHMEHKMKRVEEQINVLKKLKGKLAQSLQQCSPAGCSFEKSIPSCIR